MSEVEKLTTADAMGESGIRDYIDMHERLLGVKWSVADKDKMAEACKSCEKKRDMKAAIAKISGEEIC